MTPKWMPPPPESFTILSRLQSGTEEVVRLDEAVAYALTAVEAYKRSLKPVVRAEVGDEWQDLVQLGPMKDGELFYRLDGSDDE